MFSVNRHAITVNDCVHMAIHTDNIHLRQYWMNTAKALLDAHPIQHASQYAEGGLTLQSGGGLYHQQSRNAHEGRRERNYWYGLNY